MFSTTAFRWAVCFTILVSLSLTAPTVLANLAPPENLRQDPPDLRVTVMHSKALPMEVSRHKTAPTRITIPLAFLRGLPLGDQNKTGALVPPGSINRTLIAGVALAIAIGCLFVVIGRRIQNNRPLATAAVLLIAAGCFIGGATADIPAPRKPTPQNPADVQSDDDQKLIIEVVKHGKKIQLRLGPDATWAK